MKPKMESDTTSLGVIGVDIGEEVFHLVAMAPTGRSPFVVRSGAWASEMRLNSYRPVSLGWKRV